MADFTNTGQTIARPVRFGPFEADFQSGELRKHGVRIKLQDQPFRILAMLLQRPGEMITREELRQQLWPDGTFVEYEHSLNTSINKLRAALNDSADAPRYIETLQRRGYRFIGAIQGSPPPTAMTQAGAATAKEAADEAAAGGPISQRHPVRPAAWILMAAAGGILLVAAGIAGLWMRSPAQTKRTVRFALSARENWALSPAPPAVSPDGSSLAFLASRDGRQLLWVRPIDAVSSHPVAGTEGATAVFWSPDGRFAAFIAGGKLKKVELGTGQVSSLCDAASNGAGTWHPDGTILFQPAYSGPLFRVSADGGIPVPATSLSRERGDTRHAWPQWLPDGGHFLYHIDTQKTETTGIYAGSRDPGVPAELIVASSPGGGVYVPGRNGRRGHLLFVRGGSLMAQPFDASHRRLQGEPVRLAGDVGGHLSDYRGSPGFSVSAAGVLAYHSVSRARSQLVWLDRNGVQTETIATSDVWSHPDLSPDQRRIAYEVPNYHNPVPRGDIWVADLARNVTSRLTHHSATEGIPVWSPDGKHLVFGSFRSSDRGLYYKAVDSGKEELLYRTDTIIAASDWSRDGNFLLFWHQERPRGSDDLMALPLAGERKPFPVENSDFNETHGQFSPDSRWVVYASDESGTRELYARQFLPPELRATTAAKKVQITSGGGTQPRWRADGRELFYVSADGWMTSVSVRTGQDFEVGEHRKLFQMRGGRPFADRFFEYDVSPDGTRLVFNSSRDGSVSSITVVAGWDAVLER